MIAALSRLRRHLPLVGAGGRADILERPLLERAEILQIIQRLESRAPRHEHAREVQHRLAGEERSMFRGSGLDYEESRHYQAGDDLRFMNWKLTARTGELHMKVFREERRPALHILVDRRSAMRFGTRQRLKVTQAAIAAMLYAYAAVRQGAAVGGVLLQPELRWIRERQGEQAVFELIHAVAAPAPPLSGRADLPPLGKVLRLLLAQLPRGSRVVLLSDFRDLDRGDLPTLLQLSTEHRVEALQILDPAETALPDVGQVQLQTLQGGTPLPLDTTDTVVRAAYESSIQQVLAATGELFQATGIPLLRLFTDADAVTVLAEK